MTSTAAQQTAEKPSVRSPRLITARTVLQKFDGMSEMTLWRWLRDDRLNFPQPVYILSKRYWREADIDGWIAQRGAERK